jgi:hypothetical protein
MEFYPKVTRGRQTGEAGVNAVSTIVNDELKWLFRRVSAEHDFGIDGYIDVVTDDHAVTGQSIAIQIKTGRSFFQTKTDTGYTFRGKKKHLNYYLNLGVPVLIGLYDEKRKCCYWEQFDIRRTTPTHSGWKMTISDKHLLSGNSKPELLTMVGLIADHSETIESHWLMNKLLSVYDFAAYTVSRTDIEQANTDRIQEFIERITLNDDLCRKLQGRVSIHISGYDGDPRELWEIPEVIRWYQKADEVVRHWFFLLNTGLPQMRLYFACLCDTKRSSTKNFAGKIPAGKIPVELNNEKFRALLELNFSRLNEITNRLGMSIKENRRISYTVLDTLRIPHRS